MKSSKETFCNIIYCENCKHFHWDLGNGYTSCNLCYCETGFQDWAETSDAMFETYDYMRK